MTEVFAGYSSTFRIYQMSGNSSTTNSSSETDPWSVQQPYLQKAFNQARDLYNNAMSTGPYSGNYVAAPNQNQYNADNLGYNFGTGAALGGANNLLNSGADLLNTGTQGAASAVSGLLGTAQGNTAGNLVSQAQQIASGINVPAAVNSAMQEAYQNAGESTLPNLYRNAAATGNINSDRTALAQGVVDRGLAQTAANLTGTMENNAYTQGLTSAANMNQQNIGALQGAGYVSDMGANAGTNATTSGISGGDNAIAAAQNGANGVQSLDQSVINNNLAQFQGANNYNWQQLQNYMNIAGGRSWGSSSTGTTTQQTNPSLLSTIGSGLGVLGSLINGPSYGYGY